jgi:NitT/TauT family transport system substrate-binding protein
MTTRFFRLFTAQAAACAALFCGNLHAQATDAAPTKVSVSILYITADVGIFLALEKGYFAEQKLDVQLNRMTSGADAISLLATDKLDVGSGSASPGLYNAFRRGLPIQIVAEKASLLPPGQDGSGRLLVRRDLMESGAIKTMADLKGKRIAVNNLQSTSLNYVMRGISQGGVGQNDVTWVEMPFNQFIPAFEKKAIDAAMAYTPFLQIISEKMKLAQPMPGSGLEKTSAGDALNIMLYSPGFAKTDAAKRFMVAHLKAQRDFQRIIEGKGDVTELCRAINKYVPSMPADCTGMSFTGIDPNGGVNIDSLERYQKEWLNWGVMKEPADVRKHVNLEFSKHAVSVLGPYRR